MPVVVHCSHGWDRTSQVAALAQLLLDPYFRTRQGFACLVEKDFSAFGHPFHLRCAHGEGRNDNTNSNSGNDGGQIAPIFLQFLDCVYQLVSLFPECFEFNTKYLLLCSEHVYSCRFGNFLCDSEREREELAGIRQRTFSIWDYLENERKEETLNPSYTPERSTGVLLMPFATLMRHVHLWTDRHCMHSPRLCVRGLPVGVSQPSEPEKYKNDQQSDLFTKRERDVLIAKLHLGVSSSLPSVEESASFTIDDE